MDLSPILAQMCHEGFSQADLNAIARARGFRKQETASRATFESFFLSTIGVENALAALILPPNTIAVRQRISELCDKTTLEPDQIGEYFRLTKEIRPVTRDTVDQSFAAYRQRFLTEQGYKDEILYEDEVLNGK